MKTYDKTLNYINERIERGKNLFGIEDWWKVLNEETAVFFDTGRFSNNLAFYDFHKSRFCNKPFFNWENLKEFLRKFAQFIAAQN